MDVHTTKKQHVLFDHGTHVDDIDSIGGLGGVVNEEFHSPLSDLSSGERSRKTRFGAVRRIHTIPYACDIFSLEPASWSYNQTFPAMF